MTRLISSKVQAQLAHIFSNKLNSDKMLVMGILILTGWAFLSCSTKDLFFCTFAIVYMLTM